LIKDEKVNLHIRFKGGKTQNLSIPRPLPIARVRKTKSEVITLLNELLETCTDREAAAELNKLGFQNWKGEPFTYKKVMLIRQVYKLKSRFERLRERGFLTGEELARMFNISTTTIHTWGRSGLLRKELYGNNKRCLYQLSKGDTLIKGQGGRHPRQPNFINVQHA
jgi:hypothetical protein